MPVFYRKDMMPMSQFSELLKEYIKKKDITIKALAEMWYRQNISS